MAPEQGVAVGQPWIHCAGEFVICREHSTTDEREKKWVGVGGVKYCIKARFTLASVSNTPPKCYP